MTGPFEMIGEAAPVCVDGVCELPPADATSPAPLDRDR